MSTTYFLTQGPRVVAVLERVDEGVVRILRVWTLHAETERDQAVSEAVALTSALNAAAAFAAAVAQ
jgi:hypothetical protein